MNMKPSYAKAQRAVKTDHTGLSSNPSDTVLDPSRAVSPQALSQRRQVVFIGIELNNEYVKMGL